MTPVVASGLMNQTPTVQENAYGKIRYIKEKMCCRQF